MEEWPPLACCARVGSALGRGNRGQPARRPAWCQRWIAATDGQAASRRRLMDHSPGFLKLVQDAKSRVREVSVDEVRRKLEKDGAKLIDVREESEWAAGHARGA